MKIMRASESPKSKRGPANWFTGSVWIDEIAVNSVANSIQVLRVSFEPSSRTFWHTHPSTQTLLILSGVARIQKAGEPVLEVSAGDSVTIEAGELHWHGASGDRTMVHLAVHQTDADSVSAYWKNPVSDADYNSFKV